MKFIKLIIFKRVISISFTKYTTDVRLLGWYGDIFNRGGGVRNVSHVLLLKQSRVSFVCDSGINKPKPKLIIRGTVSDSDSDSDSGIGKGVVMGIVRTGECNKPNLIIRGSITSTSTSTSNIICKEVEGGGECTRVVNTEDVKEREVEIDSVTGSGTGSVSESCTRKGKGKGKGKGKQGDSRKVEKNINPFKVIVDINKGGYNSYLKNKALLGNISEFLNDDLTKDIEARFNKNVLDLLEDGKTYSILLQVSYISDGAIKGSSPIKSIIITKKINSKFVLQRFKIAINKFVNEYQVQDLDGKCFVCCRYWWVAYATKPSREWLSKEDYLKGITNEEVDKIVNEVLLDEMPLPYSDYIKKQGAGAGKLIDVSNFENVINILPNFDSIDKLHSIGKVAPNGYIEVGVGDGVAGSKV
jgi:hypothetical protein